MVVIDRQGKANPFWGHSHTPEAKEAIGKANRGRRHTSVTREAIAEAKRGVPRSPETKARIAASVKMAYEAKKTVIGRIT